MSISIDREQRLRASQPPTETRETRAAGPGWLVRSVQVTAVVTGLAGTTALSAGFANRDWRPALVGMVLLFAACIAGGVWITHSLLADRHAFYRRGKVDGWYEGWHGKLPDPDDPLLRT